MESMTAFDQLLQLAKTRFSHVGPLDPATLQALPEVRDMCAADKCRSYGKSWSCPPACGTIRDLQLQMQSYHRGFLVQTVSKLEDSFDFEGMMEAEEAHQRAFEDLTREILKLFPGALPMGAGVCRLCPVCSYPDAPCRFPALVFPSMEARGLLVSRVCEENGLAYSHGSGTITLTSGCLTD